MLYISVYITKPFLFFFKTLHWIPFDSDDLATPVKNCMHTYVWVCACTHAGMCIQYPVLLILFLCSISICIKRQFGSGLLLKVFPTREQNRWNSLPLVLIPECLFCLFFILIFVTGQPKSNQWLRNPF